MTATPTPKPYAVAPASPWLLLWVWLPLLAAGVLNALTSPRNGLTLGISLFVLATGIALHWAFHRRRISVQGKQLEWCPRSTASA